MRQSVKESREQAPAKLAGAFFLVCKFDPAVTVIPDPVLPDLPTCALNRANSPIKIYQFNTGFSIVLDTLEHDRTILAYKGSNNDLKYNEIDLKKLNTKWFYFSSMMGDSMTTQKKLASYANKNNIKIAYNPSSYIAERGLKFIKPIIKYAEILVLNKEEATLLANKADIPHLLKHLNQNIL